MRIILAGLSLLMACAMASAQPAGREQWWSYLATYDEGPGSIRVDLKLRKAAPVKGFPYLVVTGVPYVSSREDGLPSVAELNRVNAISMAVVDAIAGKSPHIYAGTFTHNRQQLNYIYVPKLDGMSAVIDEVYRRLCAGCKTYTNLKHDPEWAGYREFLFPNEVTRLHYGLKLD